MSLNETVFEMHFHAALMAKFTKKFPNGFGFYKYSPQKEVFVGFDQAFVEGGTVKDEDFFDELSAAAETNNYRLGTKYLAYFLQYKVVKERKRQSKSVPTSLSVPCLQVHLYTTANEKTSRSQHELLYHLSKNPDAHVYYACPLIFSKEVLYRQPVDLNLLRFVDLSSCPSSYNDNHAHHIYMKDATSKAMWCSEPREGTSLTAEGLVSKLYSSVSDQEPVESINQLLALVGPDATFGVHDPKERREPHFRQTMLAGLSDCLTILKLNP